MGCASSSENPRIFQVWNVDSDGNPILPGKIEVTDTQLILYQKKNIVVRWPLNTLRRYGFDADVFSFESGRRCTTGAGIYAFKCRRAQSLFCVLQECINNLGVSPSTIDEQIASLPQERISFPSSTSLPNGNIPNTGHTSPTVDSAGYLEPITVTSHLHYPITSVRNNNGTTSPGGYVCIHNSNPEEWTGISSGCCSLGNLACKSSNASMHHYENGIPELTAGCSNSMCIVNQYENAVAVVQTDLSRPCSLPSQCCPDQSYANSAVVTLCASHLSCVDDNTNYAKLDDLLKQEQQSVKRQKDPFYVNVKPDGNSVSSVSSKSGRSTPTEAQPVTSPTSPVSAKVVNALGYVNLDRTSPVSATVVNASGYVNLDSTSPVSAKVVNASGYVNLDRTSPVSAKVVIATGYVNVETPTRCYANVVTPPQPEVKEHPKVNYVVLDLDQTESNNGTVASTPVSVPSSMHSLVSSPVHSQDGSLPYAQIDYDKTVALSNSANPCPDFNDDSIRKTRHNAVIPCASMSA